MRGRGAGRQLDLWAEVAEVAVFDEVFHAVPDSGREQDEDADRDHEGDGALAAFFALLFVLVDQLACDAAACGLCGAALIVGISSGKRLDQQRIGHGAGGLAQEVFRHLHAHSAISPCWAASMWGLRAASPR